MGSQSPGKWQPSSAEQVTPAPPAQAPERQLSPWVQASPSSQAVPSAALGCGSHRPVAPLHTFVEHVLVLVGQVTGAPAAAPSCISPAIAP